jgi:hypothetical protein
MSANSKGALTPPDMKQCQAERPNENSFMTLGGVLNGRIRCKNKPTKLLTENAPGKDGRIGSMTVCDHCFAVFQRQMPEGYATATDLEKPGG